MSQIKDIAQKIDEADAILIGASNGLSIAEGYNIFADDERFRDTFGDFRDKYGIRSALQGAMTVSEDPEMWSCFSRFAKNYAYDGDSSQVMNNLYELVKEKPHFVVTSNTDNHFQKAGFEPEDIFEIEGNMTKMQCSKHCHDTIYSNHSDVLNMLEHEEGTTIPEEYLPKCPECGAVMRPYLPDNTFYDHNPDIEERNRAYQDFLKKYHGKKLLILELGIGARNQMIKAPLMQLASIEPNATYITFNKGELYIPNQIREKSIGVDGDLSVVLPALLEAKNE